MHRMDDAGNTTHSTSGFGISPNLTRQAVSHGGRS